MLRTEDKRQRTEDEGSALQPSILCLLSSVFCPSFPLVAPVGRARAKRMAHPLAQNRLYNKAQGDYTMKKMIEKIVDEILELVVGSFEIDPCNLKDEDMATDASRLGAAAG